MRNWVRLGAVTTSLTIFTLLACTQNKPEPGGPGATPGNSQTVGQSTEDAKAALIARGKVIYQTQCIACHNTDSHKPGALGPEVYGSSLELLEARIMRAEYPAGYSPKRATHTMVALPHLKNEIAGLHAYLNP